jgi:hypothetical protein
VNEARLAVAFAGRRHLAQVFLVVVDDLIEPIGDGDVFGNHFRAGKLFFKRGARPEDL